MFSFMQNKSTPPADYVSLLNDMTSGVLNSFKIALGATDGLLNIYGQLPERIRAFRMINQEISDPEPITIETPTAKNSFLDNLSKNQGAVIVLGALGVLGVAIVLSRGE